VPENMMPTQEKFLLSLLDFLSGQQEGNAEELAAAREVLEEAGLDIAGLRTALAYRKETDREVRDSRIRFTLNLNALERGAEKACDIKTADVVRVVLEKPSQELRRILEKVNNGNEDGDAAFPAWKKTLEHAVDEEQKRQREERKRQQEEAAKGKPDGDGGEETGVVEKADGDEYSPAESAKNRAEEMKKIGRDVLARLTVAKNELYDYLHSHVFGQEHAIDVFVNGYFQAEMTAMTEPDRDKPLATFLFAGPPGVGKTYLATKAAEKLGYGEPLMFDMSTYSTKEAYGTFCGFAKSYQSARPGMFSGAVAKRPKTVIIFDEIEKAHITIINLFLQMLDHGTIYDEFYERNIPLRDTIMIFTTNAGKQLYSDSETGDFSDVSRKVILDALKKDKNPETKEPFFPEAICSRFASGNVLMFNRLDVDNLYTIARSALDKCIRSFNVLGDTAVTFDDSLLTALMFHVGGRTDGRSISGRAKTFFYDEISELMTFVNSEKCATGIAELDNIRFVVQLPHDPEVRRLFEKGASSSRILAFTTEEMCSQFHSKCPDVTVCCADTTEKALEMLQEDEYSYVLLDLNIGKQEDDYLNMEDIASVSRDFLRTLSEKYASMPVYILLSDSEALTKEEKSAYLREGIRGFLTMDAPDEELAAKNAEIELLQYRQANIERLAKANKVVQFETAQKVSADGKTATVVLFDFQLSTAVDAEDADGMLDDVSRPDVSFSQVTGAADAKEELQFFIDYLKNPKKVLKKGAGAPKGVLLYGPPGTGKTMLAQAMAHESDVTFITAEGNQFLKKYQGEGKDAVHALFRKARKYAPSILFIDEIDAIAKQRSGGEAAVGTEATLTAFLAEMDGFKNDISKPVFVLAATNYDVEPGSDMSLDEALMRRFDRRIFVDLPNTEERMKYLKERVEENPIFNVSEDVLRNLALRTQGISIAKLKGVLDLALRMIIRTDGDEVTADILDEALETYIGGEVKDWGPEMLERVARHESGHALLNWLAGNTPSYLTIVARGDHGGYMQHGEETEKPLYTKAECLDRIRCALGGRAAEIVCYGEEDGISTGASGDLQQATFFARRMICSMGMENEFGLGVVGAKEIESGNTADEVRRLVNSILAAEMENAIRLIRENRGKHTALVQALLEKNRLIGSEIEEILQNAKN